MSDHLSVRFGLSSLPQEDRGILVIGSPDEAGPAIAPALAPDLRERRCFLRRVRIVAARHLMTGGFHLKLGTL